MCMVAADSHQAEFFSGELNCIEQRINVGSAGVDAKAGSNCGFNTDQFVQWHCAVVSVSYEDATAVGPVSSSLSS